jgi:hypothetical protein
MNDNQRAGCTIHLELTPDQLDRLLSLLQLDGTKLDTIIQTINQMETKMSVISDKLDTLRAGVERIETAEAAVAAFVAGVPALIQAAVDAAIAAGATPAELTSFDELNTRLTADAAKIAADVVANTPPPVETPPVAG